MPKTTFERVIFTTTGVILMAFTMAFFNKSLVYGFENWGIFKIAFFGFIQKAPVAWLLQFFIVQKFAGKMAGKYPADNAILYTAIRIGFSVLVMCPIMSLFSNIIAILEGHGTWAMLLFNWLPKLVVNWPFAFFVQLFLLQPLNKFIFRSIFRRQQNGAAVVAR